MNRIGEVQRLKELETKATPGPWSWYAEDHSMCWLGQTGNDQENFVLGSSSCKSCAERRERCMQPHEKDSQLISDLRNAAPWLLDVAGQFQAGDSDRLLFAIDYLRQTNCPAQCIDAVSRMLAAARIMEASG